jgi:hypothetical protein
MGKRVEKYLQIIDSHQKNLDSHQKNLDSKQTPALIQGNLVARLDKLKNILLILLAFSFLYMSKVQPNALCSAAIYFIYFAFITLIAVPLDSVLNRFTNYSIDIELFVDNLENIFFDAWLLVSYFVQSPHGIQSSFIRTRISLLIIFVLISITELFLQNREEVFPLYIALLIIPYSLILFELYWLAPHGGNLNSPDLHVKRVIWTAYIISKFVNISCRRCNSSSRQAYILFNHALHAADTTFSILWGLSLEYSNGSDSSASNMRSLKE